MDPSNARSLGRALSAAKSEWQNAVSTAEWGVRRCEIMIDVWEREVARAADALAAASSEGMLIDDKPGGMDHDEREEWIAYKDNAEANLRRNLERRATFQDRIMKAQDSLRYVEEQGRRLEEQSDGKPKNKKVSAVLEGGLPGVMLNASFLIVPRAVRLIDRQ
jgi:hypothetical protein